MRSPGSDDPLGLHTGGAHSYDDSSASALNSSSHASSTLKSAITKESYAYDGNGASSANVANEAEQLGLGAEGMGYDAGDQYDGGSGWLNFFVILVLIGVMLIICWSQRHAMLSAWHRRQARLAFPKTATMEGEATGGATAEMRPVSTWFGTTSVVQVTIELDGIQHKIGASRETFGQGLTQLPFALTDACAESGFPELADLDVVDLCISKRAELRFEGASGGALQLIDAHTTVEDVMGAKAFHVKVLPAATA